MRARLFVTLASDATSEGSDPVWVQVARAGKFDGYGAGSRPFAFTSDTFAKAIDNFRRHPSYKCGPDGVGISRVIPWDFDHASELPPIGETAATGTPAQGWVLELDVRQGPKGAELWALTEWLEPARSYIRDGKYQWASVAMELDAVEPTSGKHVGPRLTSIAITNQPFIQGMATLAASDTGALIIVERTQSKTAAEQPPAPNQERDTMDPKELAKKLGVTADESVILSEIEALVALRKTASDAFKLDTKKSTVALASDVKAAADEGMDIRERLMKMLEIMGVSDPAAAITELTNTLAKAEELKAVMPELEALRAQATEMEAAMVEEDVEEALMSMGLSDDAKARLRVALTHLRRDDKESFRKQYPKQAKPAAVRASAAVAQAQANLTRTIAAKIDATAEAPSALSNGGQHINLDAYPGRNVTERAMAYVKANIAGADKWPWEDLHAKASDIVRLTKKARTVG